MTKKASVFLCLLLTLLVFLASCGRSPILPNESGIATGDVGDIFQGKYMDVTVKSAKNVSSYGGYSPKNGDTLVDVVLRIENTSEEDILLFDTSFQLQWGEKGFADPLVAVDDHTMAPLETTISVGESTEYHYIYSVPKTVTIMKLCFSDTVPANGAPLPAGEGSFFTANISL